MWPILDWAGLLKCIIRTTGLREQDSLVTWSCWQFCSEVYPLNPYKNKLLPRQADFRRPVTAEAFLQSQVRPRESCGGRSGIGRVTYSPAFSAICYWRHVKVAIGSAVKQNADSYSSRHCTTPSGAASRMNSNAGQHSLHKAQNAENRSSFNVNFWTDKCDFILKNISPL